MYEVHRTEYMIWYIALVGLNSSHLLLHTAVATLAHPFEDSLWVFVLFVEVDFILFSQFVLFFFFIFQVLQHYSSSSKAAVHLIFSFVRVVSVFFFFRILHNMTPDTKQQYLLRCALHGCTAAVYGHDTARTVQHTHHTRTGEPILMFRIFSPRKLKTAMVYM